MGRVVHFEVPADDVGRASEFYGNVFGWNINTIPGMNYTLVSTTDSDERGMPKAPGAINGGMLERQAPIQNLLQNLKEEDMVQLGTLLEDDRVSEELYTQKLDVLLGVANDPAYDSSDIGTEGLEILKTWEQMDEGDLEFGDGLKEAVGRERGGGKKESGIKDTQSEAEPA